VSPNAARIVRSLAIYAIMLGVVGVCVGVTLVAFLCAQGGRGVTLPWLVGILSGVLVAGGGVVLASVPRPPRELRTQLPAARIIQR
jgi:hypothetical protein